MELPYFNAGLVLVDVKVQVNFIKHAMASNHMLLTAGRLSVCVTAWPQRGPWLLFP